MRTSHIAFLSLLLWVSSPCWGGPIYGRVMYEISPPITWEGDVVTDTFVVQMEKNHSSGHADTSFLLGNYIPAANGVQDRTQAVFKQKVGLSVSVFGGWPSRKEVHPIAAGINETMASKIYLVLFGTDRTELQFLEVATKEAVTSRHSLTPYIPLIPVDGIPRSICSNAIGSVGVKND